MRRKRYSFEDFIKSYGEVFRQLYSYRGKLSVRLAKLNSRLSKLQSYMEMYKERGDLETAALYAREYKVVYIVREMIWSMILKIDGVLSRIDTVKTFISGFEGMDKTVKVLSDIAKYSGVQIQLLEGISRELGNEYIDIIHEDIISDKLLKPIILPLPDAKELLTSIEKDVVKEISKRFPDVPKDIDIPISNEVSQVVNRLFEVIATDGGITSTTSIDRNPYVGTLKISININKIQREGIKRLDRKERVMLNYLFRLSRGRTCNINIYNVAKFFRTTPLEVLDILYSLSEEGLISFQ